MFYNLLLVVTPSNAVMRTNATGSLVIAMGCKKFYDISQVYLTDYTIRYISIDQACEKVGSSLCNVPAFHAFTGCDYTASFKRKRKVTPFELSEKSTETREVLTKIITDISLNSSILEQVEKYLGLLYGKKKCDPIDDVILQMFLEKYKQFSKKT